MAKFYSRRVFLKIAGSAMAGTILAACRTATPVSAPTPEPKAGEATAVPVANATAVPVANATAVPSVGGFKEAPMLAELVKAGKLPPLLDRLPGIPKVADNFKPEHLIPEIGRYGGTLRMAAPSKQYSPDCFVATSWQPMLYAPSIESDVITSNIVDYEASADNKVFTFKLQPGLKWSDGVPVTTKDVQFAVEDVLQNLELSPAGFPNWLRSGSRADGEPMQVTIVDDFTFKISFSEPYGGFPVAMSCAVLRSYDQGVLMPRHYLEQFHKKYAESAKLDALIKENNFETWMQLFVFKNPSTWSFMNASALDIPKLTPWILKEASDQRVILERNPYYFKVDAAGNQLPYIDRIDFRTVEDMEVLSLMLMAGEVDHQRQDGGVNLAKIALLKENEAKGNYKIYFGKWHVVQVTAMLNLTYKDENWRKVVRDIRFRKALSLAFNRSEFIDNIWSGFADLPTAQDSTYDPEAAKKLLDEMGMDKKDADGFRLGPDGKTFTILFEYMNNQTDFLASGQLISEFWNAVGIKTLAKPVEQTLWWTSNAANELQACIMWDTSAWWNIVPDPHNLSVWAPLWWTWWNTTGKEGEEPPPEVQAYCETMFPAFVAPPAEGAKAHSEAYKMVGENYWLIIPAKNIRQPFLSNVKLGNQQISEQALAAVATKSMEQVFFKE